MMETGRAARKPFGKLDEFIESDIFLTIARRYIGGEERGGEINVEKYRFTVYLFTQVYET